MIDGRIKYVNDSNDLFLMCLTAAASSDTTFENFLPVLVSYLIAVLIFFIIIKIIKSKGKKIIIHILKTCL